jgi:preprotein translocase subunit SecE
MNAKTDPQNVKDQRTSSALDTVILVAALAILAAGIWFFYAFDGSWPAYARMLVALASIAIAALVAFTSVQGKAFKGFLLASRLETRKIVWPTRQETVQTTLVVMVVVVIVGLLLWVLDSILGAIMRWILS